LFTAGAAYLRLFMAKIPISTQPICVESNKSDIFAKIHHFSFVCAERLRRRILTLQHEFGVTAKCWP
jgi:hypothetical protein